MFLIVGQCMKKFIAVLLACCIATPVFAASYPVSGRWGQSSDPKPGAIDCTGKRVIQFARERRFDSGGGVPDYRVKETVRQGSTAYRVTEEFNTGQVKARINYTLRLVDSDRIEMIMSPGGTLKLRRCA
jgi:hypothetical protein